MSTFESGYREEAKAAIAKVLKFNLIEDPKDIPKLDFGQRRVLKKDIEAHCPFHRRGIAFKIWETEVRHLFAFQTGVLAVPAIPKEPGPSEEPAKGRQPGLF